VLRDEDVGLDGMVVVRNSILWENTSIQPGDGGAHTVGVRMAPASANPQLTASPSTSPAKGVCWGSTLDSRCVVPNGPWIDVDGADSAEVALRGDGEVAMWGPNSAAFGDAPAGPFIQISSFDDHVAALTPDGEIVCWGDNTYGQCNAPSGPFVQVEAGDGRTFGRRPDGSIGCWGNDAAGTCQPPEGSFATMSAGWSHALALTDRGTIACWGFLDKVGCDQVPSGEFALVGIGPTGASAVAVDGTLACWGESIGVGEGISGDFELLRGGDPNSILLLTRLADCDGDGVGDARQILMGDAADVNANFVPDTCELLGDLDEDGDVDGADLAELLGAWGSAIPGPADLDHDGTVGGGDLAILLGNWSV